MERVDIDFDNSGEMEENILVKVLRMLKAFTRYAEPIFHFVRMIQEFLKLCEILIKLFIGDSD